MGKKYDKCISDVKSKIRSGATKKKCKKEFKNIGGVCVRKRGISTGRRKYNPFKMWGSWVGALGLIAVVYLWLGKCLGVSGACEIPIQGYIAYPVIFIIGFLAGWAIHSLIRKLKK